MRVLLFLLFPIFLSAQINRAYGVIEIGSFPTSSSTGPKFAYRPVDSSFYRWVSGNTWVKIIEPSIIPDTLYLTEEIGTSYKVSGDTLHLTPYLLKSDTSAMLVRYIERGDTAAMLANYPTFGDVATSLGNYLPIIGGTLTGTGGAGFIGFPSQVVAPGTPASGLNVYAQGSSFNWKGTDGFERLFASTLTGGRTYTLPDVSGTFALGTGTANRVPLWTATNTLGSSNIQDNGTAISILNSKPFQLGQWTTAGRPSGVNGYKGLNTTTGFEEGYFTSQWENYITSTGASANQVPFFTSAGKIAGDAEFAYLSATNRLGIGTATPLYNLHVTDPTQAIMRVISGTRQFRIEAYAADQVYFYSTGAAFIAGTSDANAYRIYTNNTNRLSIASDGKMGYRTTSPVYDFDMNSSNAIGLPFGATGTRPTRVAGTYPIRFNTDSSRLEINFDNTWKNYSPNALSGTTATSIQGKNSSGHFIGVGIGTGLSLGSGILTNTVTDTWLGSRLVAADVDINADGHNLRIDSIPALFLSSNSTANLNGATVSQTKWLNTARTKYFTRNFQYDSRGSVSPGAYPAWWNIITKNLGSGEAYEWVNMIQWDTVNNVINHSLGGRYENSLVSIRSQRPLTGYSTAAGIEMVGTATAGDVTNSRFIMFRVGSDSLLSILNGGTLIAYKYGTGNKEAADLSKTQSNYIAGFATDGTVLDYSLSNLPNGIYTGSGTLASHTTRAAIPETGNLLFTQKYNSNADSAYIQVINGLDGNREVRIGLTDTMSTGSATLVLRQDADNEVMAWDLRSSDGSGATRLTGDGGNISATVDEGFEFQVSGMVRAKREAYHEITSTSSPQTLSSTYSDNLINQGGTQATFTLNMPASPEDGQVCYITFNNAISTLTIDGNGETIVGSAVVTGVAGSQRKFKFYSGIGWIKQY